MVEPTTYFTTFVFENFSCKEMNERLCFEHMAFLNKQKHSTNLNNVSLLDSYLYALKFQEGREIFRVENRTQVLC